MEDQRKLAFPRERPTGPLLRFAQSGSASAADRLLSGAARRVVAKSPLRPQTTPDSPLRAVRQARDERRRAPLGPVSEQEQQQDDDGDDERDDRDGPGIHENVPPRSVGTLIGVQVRAVSRRCRTHALIALQCGARTATSSPSSSRPLLIYASGAGALLPFAQCDSEPTYRRACGFRRGCRVSLRAGRRCR
jgi:hypothetical protein